MLETWLLVFFFLLGLSVGSFVNVAVLRFGFTERSLRRSHCASCEAQLKWYDLIPVFSYLFLRGRCRQCGSRIAVQYPLVELTVGLLFALSYASVPMVASAYALVGFVGLLIFWAALVAIVAYDVRHTLVPLQFVLFFIVAAALVRISEALIFTSMYPLLDALLGALAFSGFFAAVTFFSGGRGMGIGDAYVASGIGILLGLLPGFEAIVIGVWAGTIFYLTLLLFSRVRIPGMNLRVTMKTELPFAPWIFLGAVISVFTDFSPLLAIEQAFTMAFP